jgi:hypothetical protein
MAHVRRAKPAAVPLPSVADLISGLFPRLAVGSACLILVLLTIDLALSTGGLDLETAAAAAAEELLFVAR